MVVRPESLPQGHDVMDVVMPDGDQVTFLAAGSPLLQPGASRMVAGTQFTLVSPVVLDGRDYLVRHWNGQRQVFISTDSTAMRVGYLECDNFGVPLELLAS